MSWYYSGDPGDSDKDHVRFLIGDTDEGSQLISDEEIAFLLTNESVLGAAVKATEAIAAVWSRKADRTIGDLRLSYENVSKQFLELSKRLRRQMTLNLATPYMGGKTHTDKDANFADSDKVRPAFTVDMMENPGTDFDEDLRS